MFHLNQISCSRLPFSCHRPAVSLFGSQPRFRLGDVGVFACSRPQTVRHKRVRASHAVGHRGCTVASLMVQKRRSFVKCTAPFQCLQQTIVSAAFCHCATLRG